MEKRYCYCADVMSAGWCWTKKRRGFDWEIRYFPDMAPAFSTGTMVSHYLVISKYKYFEGTKADQQRDEKVVS